MPPLFCFCFFFFTKDDSHTQLKLDFSSSSSQLSTQSPVIRFTESGKSSLCLYKQFVFV